MKQFVAVSNILVQMGIGKLAVAMLKVLGNGLVFDVASAKEE